MDLIKGIVVTLYEQVQDGADGFGAPIYREQPVSVDNVLVSPVSAEGVASDIQMHGKHSVYELSIPKEDTHIWTDRRVDFWGQSWRTIGFPQRWIDENVPLAWNQKIRVERYG